MFHDNFIDVQWKEIKRKHRLITVKEWIDIYPNASLWALAWSIWWRIILMALGTTFLVGLIAYGIK